MGKVAAAKPGRGGRSRSKGKDSDDSDEDYMIEEDEDYIEDEEEELFSNEEDKNDDDDYDEEEETGQCYIDLPDHDIGFKEGIDEEDFCKTPHIKRKRSGLARMKFGTQLSNIQRNGFRSHDESDDENETQTERLQVSEEEEAVNEVNILKRKRSCLDLSKVRSKVSRIRQNANEKFDDEDYNVEEMEEEDDEEEDQTPHLGVSDEEQEIDEVTSSNVNRVFLGQNNLRTKTSNSGKTRHGKVDDEDYNFDDDEEDDEDDDFTLDESFSFEEEDDEEEEEHVVKKRKKINKPIKRTLRKKSSGSRRRKRRTNAASKVGKKRKESRSTRGNVGSYEEDDDDDCEDEEFTNIIVVRKRRTKKKPRRRIRNFTVHSDSDFVDSGPSEIEFTISEEEREQVREASNICRKSTVPLRSSCSYEDNDSFAQKRKRLVTKGKEKIPELKKDVVKQVCGICFSEEGKNTVRGALNSCSHYFCFTCILEWSKVESRCPLCKQRFQAITKLVKANTGVDSKDIVLKIPERDQVYQPTEEEIRGYLDPYENVICTECREGGADELMLLCDLCDSPAHTFCVGLGHEVPEGNWYCEGCRPASMGPSNNQVQDSITGQRNLFHRLYSFEGIQDDFGGSISTPSTSFPQGFGSFLSPRYLGGGTQASSPRSGTGVVTVLGRRQMHRQIQFIVSNNRSRQASDALIGDTVEGYNTRVGQSHSSHMTSSPARPPEIGTSFSTQFNEGSCNTPTPQSMQFLPVSSPQLAEQLVLVTPPILDEINIQGTSRSSNISTSHNVQPFILSNNTNIEFDYHMSSSTFGGGSNSYLEEQVKHLVQNYVESMSRTLTLDRSILEDIERKSQNTILAAYGHLHHPSEVLSPMPLQPMCVHIENPLIPASPIKDQCSSCFNTFVKEVVKTVMNSKLPNFLHVRD